jgi:hypothetical protein
VENHKTKEELGAEFVVSSYRLEKVQTLLVLLEYPYNI